MPDDHRRFDGLLRQLHLAAQGRRSLADAPPAQDDLPAASLAAHALAGHELLDAFAYPVWLLDADRRVYHANAAALALTCAGGTVENREGRLHWLAPAAERLLGERLRALRRHARHGQRWTVDTRSRLCESPRRLQLDVLVPGRVPGGVGERPLIRATLIDPSLKTALDPSALADIFGMTPAEARVAVLLADGLTARAIGARLCCATATVRTHLRRVLLKLGAARLADAVRLLRQGQPLWTLKPTIAPQHSTARRGAAASWFPLKFLSRRRGAWREFMTGRVSPAHCRRLHE